MLRMNKTIYLGLSGGVDSAVCAKLLKDQGHNVVAVFMKNWEADDSDEYCTSEQDAKDAKAICDLLNIPLHSVNFAKNYWDRVFEHFLNEYQAGRTPNPDILCNTEIKFKAFLDYALENGADKIAMGHYARVVEQNGAFQLLKGLDDNKDQSYFLHGLNQAQLSKSCFPIGNLNKTDVRNIAKKAGLPNFNKKDSTGICFIGERKFKNFLSEYLPAQPGDIQTEGGETIGRHDGLMYYTIGQRKGIQVGGLKNKPEAPWYVIQKDLKRNVLVIAQNNNHPALFKTRLTTHSMHWISGQAPAFPFNCTAKIRYRQQDQACTIEKNQDGYVITFQEPQRAITPGQSIVLYRPNVCLGGGIIC